MSKPRLIAGAMSGTSADGVDVALVSIQGHGLDMTAQLLHHHAHPYDAPLKKAIFDIRATGQASLSELAQLARQISLAYAHAVYALLQQTNTSSADLSAIAAHGQTLFHAPPTTIQWFDPALLAAEVNCPVVSDFRRADCAAGGQGAPLVPFADYILFRHPTKTRLLLNIGGIANITYLKAGGSPTDIRAFDTGPANCISDHICRTRGPFGQSWDVDGQGASHGRVMFEAVQQLLKSPYFTRKPPKSTDGPEMISLFEAALSPGNHEINDLLATASYLTAASIHQATTFLGGPPVEEVIASGGGIYNKAIMGWLASNFAPAKIVTTHHLGIAPHAKEAVAFALLGAATLDNLPSNIPSCTGAARSVVLGSITPRP